MAAKQILFDVSARHKTLRGVELLARAVKVTLGPRGRHVVIDQSSGTPTVTKDGVSVAKEIELPDPFDSMGVQMVKARRSVLETREMDDILRAVDHMNLTTQWAQSRATEAQLESVTDRLLMAMHDLRSVLVRKKADRIGSRRAGLLPQPTRE